MVDIKDIQETFEARHATKQFQKDRLIADEDFGIILEAARLSPSSYGFEPWDIIVVEDKTIVKEIIDAGSWGAKRPAEFASKFVIMTARRGEELVPHESERITHVLADIKGMDDAGVRGYNNKFAEWQRDDFDLHTPELLHQWAARQAYIALGNMMTVAKMREIDSCPIEGFSIRRVAKILESHGVLDSAKDLPIVMVAFGFASGPAPIKTRRPINEVVRTI